MAYKYSFFIPLASIGQLDVDWLETDDAHLIKMDVPGLRKEDLNIQIMEGNVLQIVGVHTGSVGGEGYTHISERPRGTFLRQYRLPDTALLDKVQAFDQDGILTITIPKLKPRVRTIPIFVSKL